MNDRTEDAPPTMKLGYPCINTTIGCTANSTFRLASYSNQRFIETVRNNIRCTARILRFNVEHGLLFFRIGDLVPFASHPVCRIDWPLYFRRELAEAGQFIADHGIRISMHPDQFVLLNALDEGILRNSLEELDYHAKLLDALRLDSTAKIQIHAGGVYGGKSGSIARFAERCRRLPPRIRRRLVIENDDRSYGLADCLEVHRLTGVPVVFDNFHHERLNAGEPLREALLAATATWAAADGLPMVDYSSQQPAGPRGRHATSVDLRHFGRFLDATEGLDFDIMLEIKDKEQSALRAIRTLRRRRMPAA